MVRDGGPNGEGDVLDVHSNPDRVRPDSFRVGRLSSLQPRMSTADLADGLMGTDDPLVLNHVTNLIRLWSQARADLPDDFYEHIQVVECERVPVALLAVATQYVQRSLRDVVEPFTENAYDGSPWPTQDLFELAAYDPLRFPQQEVKSEQALAGQEEVFTCHTCTGAGAVECGGCKATGRVRCDVCGGAKHLRCTRCNGAGTLIQGQSLVDCQACGGLGARECGACDALGQTACKNCEGDGTVECGTCRGHQQLKRRWILQTALSTKSHHVGVLPEAWPITADELLPEADLLASQEWIHKTVEHADVLRDTVPGHLAQDAERLVANVIDEGRQFDSSACRITGLRFMLSGAYAFRVRFAYRDTNGEVYIGGHGNRIFPADVPAAAPSGLKLAKRRVMKMLAALKMGVSAGLDRRYLRAVADGRAHISDTRSLIPALAEKFGLQTELTEDGYRVTVQTALPDQPTLDVAVEVILDVSAAKELVLAVTYPLGPAHRERFPTALALNHRLSFGRLAAIADPANGGERFALVDRRLYEITAVEHYACILTVLAHEIRELVQSECLS